MAAVKLDTNLHSAHNSVPPVCDMGVPMPMKPTPQAETSRRKAPSLGVRPVLCLPLYPASSLGGERLAGSHRTFQNAKCEVFLASMVHTWHFPITSVGPCSVE